MQQEADKRGEIEGMKVLLNLQLSDTGVLECRGRIAGQYPMFLPENSKFTRKVVEQTHLTTLPWSSFNHDTSQRTILGTKVTSNGEKGSK